MSARIVVVTGTKREAAVLRDPALTVIAGGGDADALAAGLRVAAPGAAGIVSFGMAGALVEGLAIGDWVIGDRVTGAVDHACDPRWSAALAAVLPSAWRGAVHADGRMIDTVAGKRALAAGGAIAVDMESHVAAAIAGERGLPLAVVRCVSDEASRSLPPAIAVAMRSDGGLDGAAMLRSLAANPAQLPSLARTLAGFARAMAALRSGARALEPALARS